MRRISRPDLVSEFFGTSASSRQIEVLMADLRTELQADGLATPLDLQALAQ